MPDTPRPRNVLSPNCPSRRALDLIADKWALLVLIALSRGTARYAELERSIGGVSQKMLTQTLRRLERHGLLTRTAHPSVPVTVEYALSDLGASLMGPVRALRDWAEAHAGDLEPAPPTGDRQ